MQVLPSAAFGEDGVPSPLLVVSEPGDLRNRGDPSLPVRTSVPDRERALAAHLVAVPRIPDPQ
jgi:hypothetical protein